MRERTKSTKHPQDAAFPPTLGRCLRASHVTRGTCWWSRTIPPSLFHTLPHRLHPFPHPQPQCSSTFSLIGLWGRRNRARGRGGQDRCVFFRKIPKTQKGKDCKTLQVAKWQRPLVRSLQSVHTYKHAHKHVIAQNAIKVISFQIVLPAKYKNKLFWININTFFN